MIVIYNGYDIDLNSKEVDPGVWQVWADLRTGSGDKTGFSALKAEERGWPTEEEAVEHAVKFAKDWIDQHG